MHSNSALKWNRGGWLGGQLGGTAWILLAGLLSLPKNMPVALGVIGLFGVANIMGWILWRQREKITAHAGFQILLPVIGICGLGTVFLLDRARIYDKIQQGGTISAAGTYLIIILTVLVLMAVFYIRFGRMPQSD